MPIDLHLIVAQATVPAAGDGGLRDGIAIAAVGLLIVFVALVLISLFIAALPRVLEWINVHWPEVEDHHGVEATESRPEDDLAVLAAIGFVLHTEYQRQLHGDAATQTPS